MMDYAPSPAPLKSKLDRVKHLLDDANKRLHEEYEIFTTKTSGSSATTASTQQKQNGHLGNNTNQDVPLELRRTITDISTIQSVLSCPIFGQIVNVTDSLDQLSYHLNLRPSIGPVDINIDSNGELILAPQMEPTMLNNLINNRLDEYSNMSQSSTNRMLDSEYYIQNNSTNNNMSVDNNTDDITNANTDIITNPANGSKDNIIGSKKIDNKQHQFDEIEHQGPRPTRQTPMHVTSVQNDNYVMANEFLQSQNENINGNSNAQCYHSPSDPAEARTFKSQSNARPLSGVPPLQQQQQKQQQQQRQQQQHQEYNNEKLVANGIANKDYVNGNRRRRSQEPSKVQTVAAAFESAIAESSENRRLYKVNGNFALNELVPNSVDMKRDFETTRSMSQINEQSSLNEEVPQNLGYTNDLYRTTDEVASGHVMAMNYNKLPVDTSNHDQNAYANNIEQPNVSNGTSTNGLIQQNRNGNGSQNNQRASPSTSAGSTVRLADECDSGTSSFRSQAAKGNLYSPQSHKPIPQLDEDSMDSSIDRELIEKLSPEMERIKVTLERDSKNGLGITIAGYFCAEEELSGMFIKSIAPGSPADRSDKIRILDQIFAVNGEEILGYTNKEAVSILKRHTGRVVDLELMRYLSESKYQKLKTLLNGAEPAASRNAAQAAPNGEENFPQSSTKTVGANRLSGREHASNITTGFANAQPGMSTSSPKQTYLSQPAVVEAASQQQCQLNESVYNNTSVFYDSATDFNRQNVNRGDFARHTDNQTPVAAQRGAAPTNKVIETKQGSRNTIDIRSPMCQATATYVNEISDMMFTNSAVSGNSRSIIDRLKHDAPEEFRNLVRSDELEWERDVQIVELYRDQSQSLGFSVKDYADPKDPQQSIFMIVSITCGGVAERDGRLSVGDLLKFVDDTNLEGASTNEAVKALKKTCGRVTLGVLKYKRNY